MIYEPGYYWMCWKNGSDEIFIGEIGSDRFNRCVFRSISEVVILSKRLTYPLAAFI